MANNLRFAMQFKEKSMLHLFANFKLILFSQYCKDLEKYPDIFKNKMVPPKNPKDQLY